MKKLKILSNKIQAIYDNLMPARLHWRIKKRVRMRMIKNYEQNYEVELLLEQWVIKRILDGNTDRRKELAEMQAKIKEMDAFLSHLKELK